MLASYLKEREKEVVDIMIMLFDQEYAVEQYGKQQKAEGENKLGTLMAKLFSQNRLEDAKRCSEDAEYREKLYQEFKLA